MFGIVNWIVNSYLEAPSTCLQWNCYASIDIGIFFTNYVSIFQGLIPISNSQLNIWLILWNSIHVYNRYYAYVYFGII
jgi:hypothetical protein